MKKSTILKNLIACFFIGLLACTTASAQCPTISVSAGDTLLCGGGSTALMIEAPLDSSGSLIAAAVNNNGQDGNMFDIVATNTITILNFEGNIANTPNATTEYYVYYKVGTHVGFETTAAAWTQLAGPISFNPNTPNTFTLIPTPINITIPAGQRYAFYLTNTSAISNNNRYHNGTATGNVSATNADLTLYEGTGGAYPFGTFFNARPWEGRVIYATEPTYSWSTGATTQSITVAPGATTDYIGTATYAGLGCSSSDTLQILVGASASVNIGADTTLCQDTLSIYSGGGVAYSWSTGATDSSIIVSTSGTYYVDVTDSIGCTASDTMVVTMIPDPVVDLGADTTYCEGVAVTLDAGTGFAGYLWNTQASTQTIVPTVSGPYSVTVTDTLGCEGSDTIAVTINPLPVAGYSETINGLTVSFTNTATNGVTYLWDFGDSVTSTAANPTHTYANVFGTYTVQLIATNACGSDTFTRLIVFVGIENELGHPISVFPNPSKGTFRIQAQGLVADEAALRIFTLQGTAVYQQSIGALNGNLDLAVSLPELAAGVYLLHFQVDGKSAMHRLLIE